MTDPTCQRCGGPRPQGPSRKVCPSCSRGKSAREVERQKSLETGAGPLSDCFWRKIALAAVETWERFGGQEWDAQEWTGAFAPTPGPSALRMFERYKVAWRNAGLAPDVRCVSGPVGGLWVYQFSPSTIDRLRLVAELLDRYLAAKKEPPCSSEPALHPDQSSSSNSRAS